MKRANKIHPPVYAFCVNGIVSDRRKAEKHVHESYSHKPITSSAHVEAYAEEEPLHPEGKPESKGISFVVAITTCSS